MREFSFSEFIIFCGASGFSCHLTGKKVCCPQQFDFDVVTAFLSLSCAPQRFLNIIHRFSSCKRNECCGNLGEVTNIKKKKTETCQSPSVLRVCGFLHSMHICLVLHHTWKVSDTWSVLMKCINV